MQKEWWKEAVIYQIYPRSFKDSNGDKIGDIPGIIEKLDYLKDLGVDVVWLSPVYKSPNVDNGYDISDYKSVMEEFGTMEDLECLIREMHKRDLKLMMDIVVNHTSNQHEWFKKSCQPDEDNPYADFYIWRKGKDGGPPNNWGSFFGGSAWEYCEARKMYYLHMFAKEQPDLNWENPNVRHEVEQMMNWWMQKGVDGFRLDVINLIGKDQKFPDGKKQEGELYGDMIPFTHNMPQAHIYIKELNEKVFSKYPMITVGETLETTVEDGKKYSGFYVVTKKLTGAQIKEMLESSLTIQKNCIVANDSGEWDAWPNDSGSYLQVGGITVRFDPAQPAGERVLSVQKDGQELDDTKEYTVAVNNYLAGSDSYPQLADAAEVGEYSCCEELLIQFFEQGSDAVTASAAKQNMIQTTKETEEPEQPSVPVTPSVPEQPSKEQPEAVKTEVKKEQASGTKTSVKSPKTADSNELFCWMVLLLLSGGAGSICLVQGNKR